METVKPIEKKRANSVITTAATDNGITFAVAGCGELELDVSKLSAEVQRAAMIHGLKQRIADAAALSRDDVTGKPAPAADKFDAMRELVDYYNSGTVEWNRPRASGGGVPSGGILLRAMVIAYPDVSRDDLKAKIAGWTKQEQAAVRASKKIKAIIDGFEKAATSDIDADALLDSI